MSEDAFPPVRRLIAVEGTGGGQLRSDEVLSDGRPIGDGVRSTHLWATSSAPSFVHISGDGSELLSGSPPPAGGTRVGVLDILPGATAGPLHRTDTIDYAICISGAVELELGQERRSLAPGDVVVQCGATHTWRNPGAAPARLIFVMIDAEPKRAGSLGSADNVTDARPR